MLSSGFALLALLLASVGLFGVMSYNVARRTREIGIRMAVGAHARDILRQFLVEAFTLSSMGGAIGILLGTIGSRLLSSTAHWPTLVSGNSIGIAFLFSAAVGIFFGFYPARKASQLDPIDALRYE